MNKIQAQDLDLFAKGLNALVSTFTFAIDDFDEGIAALALARELLDSMATAPSTNEATAPTPTPSTNEETTTVAPIQVQEPVSPVTTTLRNNMNDVITALRSKPYSVNQDLNGDVFHIIEHHLKADVNTLSVDDLVMALNMARVIRKDKEAKMTLAERAEIFAMHPSITATTKKDSKEQISEIEKRLEEVHGKYATKASLTKTKFDTSATYESEWLNKISGFADNLANQGMTLDDFLVPSEASPEPQVEAPDLTEAMDTIGKLDSTQTAVVEATAGQPIEEVIKSPDACREVANRLARDVNTLEAKSKTTASEAKEISVKTYSLLAMDLAGRQSKSAMDRFMGK